MSEMSFCGGSEADEVAGERHDGSTRTCPGVANFSRADEIAAEVLQATSDAVVLYVIGCPQRRIVHALVHPHAIARTLPIDGVVVRRIEIVVVLHRERHVL